MSHDKGRGHQEAARGGAPPASANRPGLGGRPTAPEGPPMTQVDQGVIAAATAAAVAALQQQRTASAPTPNLDKTVPGGVYIVDGKVVDAFGNEREMPEEGAAGNAGESQDAGEAGAEDKGK
jgi:hypothetical protein